MRRRPGLQGIAVNQKIKEDYRTLGEENQAMKLARMRNQLDTFKSSLEQFAAAHKDDIRKNPAFRQQFHSMCANIGVDPLVSNKGGTWAQKLGLGDFYYSLAVTVLDVCKARRAYDGGLTDLSTLIKHVERRRGSTADPISADDIIRALNKLSILGGGLGVVSIGGRPFVRSIPAELSTDGNTLIDLAHKLGGFFTRADVEANLKWQDERTSIALLALAKEGLLWVDDPPSSDEKQGTANYDNDPRIVDKEYIKARRIYWCPAVGMEAAVEEYQKRENLPVAGFDGSTL